MEQRPKGTETADAPRVEYLLGVLRSLPPQDPPPALRDRLQLLSMERLRGGAQLGRRFGRPQAGLHSWFRPAVAFALLIAIGSAAVLVVYLRQSERLRVGIESRVAPPKQALNTDTGAQAAVPAADAPKITHSLPRLARNIPARRMIVRLPYSNSAIDNGTDATIRVSMSQAELVSLGFPMTATLHDRRVVADLTLGDDGLPRAISVPLPLEVVREKK
ncbi:MAG TPA: hypothetical protein VFE27_01890 [Acidobacteriaceae bacterium]|nr:hypothetical protein [Acidobacteriaceae bacterium]